MNASTTSSSIIGVKRHPVRAEAHIGSGLVDGSHVESAMSMRVML
jgi:hypothetical protein